MLYREIIAVCSEIHTKHINTLCGQNVEFVNFGSGGTTGLYRFIKHVGATCTGYVLSDVKKQVALFVCPR
jgi:hypothetical protein